MPELTRSRTATTVLLAGATALLASCSGAGGENVPGDSGDAQPFAEIAPDHTLRLTGTEPFWNGTINGETLLWSTPDNLDGEDIEIVRFPGRGGVSFSGALDGAQLDILVTPAECSDGMSDRTYPYFAAVRIGTETREGCAWRDGIDDVGEP